jgi:hypothetical protein
MASSDATVPTNEPVKFDYAKFFRYIRESARPRLLQLLRSMDRRAQIELASFVAQYFRPPEKEPGLLERRQRGARIKRVLPQAIASLRKAAAKYREVAAIETPGAGSLITARAPLWLQAFPLVDVLESEAARLSNLLEDSRKLFNEKRLGVSGNHIWLVMLQDFVLAWTEQELGQARALQPGEVATLIKAGRLTSGWSRVMSEKEAELIPKAIRHFRLNRANAGILDKSAKQAREHCQTVRNRPYILQLGIEN